MKRKSFISIVTYIHETVSQKKKKKLAQIKFTMKSKLTILIFSIEHCSIYNKYKTRIVNLDSMVFLSIWNSVIHSLLKPQWDKLVLRCLWNKCVKHIQASQWFCGTLLWPLYHSFYLTVTTDRLLLFPCSKTVTLTLSCQLFMSKCPALYRMLSLLIALCLGPSIPFAFCTLADKIELLFLRCFYLCNKLWEVYLYSEFPTGKGC